MYLEKNKIPPLAKANGVIFPVKPRELDLSELEERLVAARIPFMQLRELPRGGQMSLHGNIVNVPTTIFFFFFINLYFRQRIADSRKATSCSPGDSFSCVFSV